MKNTARWILTVSVCSLLLMAQESHRRPLPDLPPPQTPSVQQQALNPAELKREAEQLSMLAQSIPGAIDQVGRGLHPKDVDEKLRTIEKLSKKLRRELSR